MSTYINPRKPSKTLYSDCPEILTKFLNYIKAIRNLSDRTVNGYYLDLRTFFRFLKMTSFGIDFDEFNTITISDISVDLIKNVSAEDIYEYLSFCAGALENAPAARCRKLSAIKSFYKYYTTKSNLFENNPALDIETPKKPKKQPKFLSYDECLDLLKASASTTSKERDICMVALFLNCGMRLSELVNINIYDIHDDKIRIIGKGNKERFAYLNEFCRKTVDDYLKVRKEMNNIKDKNALFLSKRGTRITGRRVEQIIESLLKTAGLDGLGYSVHKLRHTAATQMYRSGAADMMTLREILGHANIATTEIYTHIAESQVVSAIENSPMNIELETIEKVNNSDNNH